jgi:L-amino acid N-acyltransferase YncA
MIELHIRTAQLDDADGIIAILNPIIQTGLYTALDTPLTPDAEREFISGFSSRGVFHVAESVSDGRIVGFQSLEPFATYTHAFDHVGVIGTFVDLALRRQGVGTCLAEATFEAGLRKGYEKIFTYVRADNAASLEFPRRLGFRIVGTAQKQARFGAHYIDEIIIENLL